MSKSTKLSLHDNCWNWCKLRSWQILCIRVRMHWKSSLEKVPSCQKKKTRSSGELCTWIRLMIPWGNHPCCAMPFDALCTRTPYWRSASSLSRVSLWYGVWQVWQPRSQRRQSKYIKNQRLAACSHWMSLNGPSSCPLFCKSTGADLADQTIASSHHSVSYESISYVTASILSLMNSPNIHSM